MATYTFETITADEALALTSTDSLVVSTPTSTANKFRVTYEVTAVGEEARLVVTHSDLNEPGMRAGVSSGWPLVLSSLKSFLETGKGLDALNVRIKELG